MSELPTRFRCRLTTSAAQSLKAHLLSDRSREQLAVAFCAPGLAGDTLTLTVRELALFAPEAFSYQRSAGLVTKVQVERAIHRHARETGLIEMDWHSHPGAGTVRFSTEDTAQEAALARYLARHLRGAPYASAVLNDDCVAARIWLCATPDSEPRNHAIESILTTDLEELLPESNSDDVDESHTRQVLAFGVGLQRRLAQLRFAVVGVGGIGSQLVAHLARLGAQRLVLIDPDNVELCNLGRLAWGSRTDALTHQPKVEVARKGIMSLYPSPKVQTIPLPVDHPEALAALKSCDMIIAATDNHASRIVLNRFCARHLIPLLHVGFHLSSSSDTKQTCITDISGEVVLPEMGQWCLECAGLIQPAVAALEELPNCPALQSEGYLPGTPQAAVGHLDGIVAALATAQLHNVVAPFAPKQRYLVYDGLQASIQHLIVPPSVNCPVCSPDRGLLALGDLQT